MNFWMLNKYFLIVYKSKYLIIISLTMFFLSSKYIYATEQICMSSDVFPNYEIGYFSTKGNPHKFKKQKIKYSFLNNINKKEINKYITHVVGIT